MVLMVTLDPFLHVFRQVKDCWKSFLDNSDGLYRHIVVYNLKKWVILYQ